MAGELSLGAWTATVAASLALHAALAAGLAPLLNTTRIEKAATEITFAEPELANLPAAPPPAQSPRAPPAEVEELAPAGGSQSLGGKTNGERAAALTAGEASFPAGAAQPAPTVATAAAALRGPVADLAEVPPADALAPSAAPAKNAPRPALTASASAELLDAAEAEALAESATPGGNLPAIQSALPEAPAAAEALEPMRTDGAASMPGVAAAPPGPGASALSELADAPLAGAPAVPRLGTEPTSALPIAGGVSPLAPAQIPLVGRGSASRGRPVAILSPLPLATVSGAVASPSSRAAPLESERIVSSRPAIGDAPAPSGGVAVASAPLGAERLSGAASGDLRLVPAEPDGGNGRGSAAWQEAVAFVQSFGGSGCFAALPAERSDGVGFQAFSSDRAEIKRFADASARQLPEAAAVLRGNLARVQCSAIELARSSKLYPNFNLSIVLDPPSGDFEGVSGEIRGAGDREVQLLLIDVTGAVQTVENYAAGEDGPLPFEFPFTREELAAARGLFLAVASDKPLANLRFQTEMSASEFFTRLREEAAAEDIALDIAIRAFDVARGG
jgi:hypothetical protein